MSLDQHISSFGDASAQPPPTPKQTPTSIACPSPLFETPKNPQGSFTDTGGSTPRFAEEYSVFNSTPGNLRGTHGPFADFVPAIPLSATTGHKRLLSAGTIALDIATRPNHYPANPNAPLPSVDPSRRLPSSPAVLCFAHGHNTSDAVSNTAAAAAAATLPGHSSIKKARRGSVESPEPTQVLSPPPTARKGERELEPKDNMQNDQNYGQSDFHDGLQPHEMAAMMASSGDMFGYPMSAPAVANNHFWDPSVGMNMDLDFGSAAANMFQPSTTSSHRHTGSFDWNNNIQLFQDPCAPPPPPPSSNQENVQPARRERALAPKPPMPGSNCMMTTSSAMPVTYSTSMDDPFSLLSPGDAVDPGLLFGRPHSSAMEADFNFLAESMPSEPIPMELNRMPVGQPRRVVSAKEARKGKVPDRASASSPVKSTTRPGLGRSFSESRGKRALARGPLPTLAPAAKPTPQANASGVEGGRSSSRSSGRTSPLKSQRPLSSLAPIPESLPQTQLGFRPRTSVRFTIDSHGRARAETTLMVDQLAGGLSRSRSSQDLSRRGSWESSGDDSSTDEEPIIIPSRNNSFNASFALPDPRKPVGSIFNSSRRSFSNRSTSTLDGLAGGGGGGESEAETVVHETENREGDAASELRKLVEDRQKRSSQRDGNRSQRFLTTTNLGNFPTSTVSPTSLTDSAYGTEGHGVRCVCNKNRNDDGDGFLVQCESCEMWLHGKCVNITRRSMPSVYICGFCAQTGTMASRRGRESSRGNTLGLTSTLSAITNKSFRSFR